MSPMPSKRYGKVWKPKCHTLAIIDVCFPVQDWFYACRWVPSRHLAPRVRSLHLGESQPWGNEIAMRYQAHRWVLDFETWKHIIFVYRNLMPTTGVHQDMQERNLRLTPKKYREMYTRIIQSSSFEELNAIMETHKH